MNTERNQDTCKARTRFVIAFLAVCFVMIVAEKAQAQTRYWNESPTITFDRDNTTGALQVAVGYAAWSMGQRTGLSLDLTGFGDERTLGAIHVRTVTRAQATADGATSSALAYVISAFYQGTDQLARAELRVLDYEAEFLTDRLLRAAVHEMGHAVGIPGHSTDPHDIMYRGTGYGDQRYTLSSGDISMLHSSYGQQGCHAEVDRDGDVYIPAIEGYGAELITTGAGTYTLGSVSDPGETCSGVITGSVVTLYDVRSMDGRYRVELDMLGPDFTLLSVQDYGSAEVKARSSRASVRRPTGAVIEGAAVE